MFLITGKASALRENLHKHRRSCKLHTDGSSSNAALSYCEQTAKHWATVLLHVSMQDCRSLNKDCQISPCRAGTPVLPAFFRPPQHSSPHKSCALRERERKAGIVLQSPHISKCLCHDAVVFLKVNYSLIIHLLNISSCLLTAQVMIQTIPVPKYFIVLCFGT